MGHIYDTLLSSDYIATLQLQLSVYLLAVLLEKLWMDFDFVWGGTVMSACRVPLKTRFGNIKTRFKKRVAFVPSLLPKLIVTRGLSASQLHCLIIHCLWYTSQMNTQWPWLDLSMPPKIKCHGVNWNIIYDLLYVFHAKFDKMLHLGDSNFWKSCVLDLTLKGYPRSNVLR